MKKLLLLLMFASPAFGATDSTGRSDFVMSDVRATVVDVAADSTTVYVGKAIVCGIYVNTVLSAHALPIQDNATPLVTLVASLAAGSNLAFGGCFRVETSLVVDPNDAATGNITLFWSPL